MKKIWVVISTLAIFSATGVFAEPDMESFTQDAERNKELLDIWKDHVKTLTKERDDAYRQIEQMKLSGAGPVAQFGGVETVAIPSPAMTEQMQGLQTEVMRLQGELQRKSAGDPSREMQMQFSALQRQAQQTKKELNEARSEKDRLIQEKEKALSRAERLEAENEELRKSKGGSIAPSSSGPRSEDTSRIRELEGEVRSLNELRTQNEGLRNEIAVLQEQNQRFGTASGDPDREKEAFMRQARELQYQNDTLKAQIEKLQVVEKELSSTRGYFTPVVKDLQDRNESLTSEIASMRSENASLRSQATETARQIQSGRSQSDQLRKELEAVQAEVESLKTQNQRSGADLRTLQAEHEQTAAQNETLRQQLQMASADQEKWKLSEAELTKLRDQHDSLQKAYGVLEKNAASREHELQKTSQALAGLQTAERAREKYKAALSANLTDMKNLKSNFEAYLESLVASFEERQK